MITQIKKIAFVSPLIILGLVLFVSTAEAKHLKLYSYDVLSEGRTAVTYTYDYVDGVPDFSSNPNLHELEFEYGFTNNWTQSLYIDYDVLSGKEGNVSEITSVKTEVNYAFSEKGKHFVDFRLNVEYAMAVGDKVDAFGGTDAADTLEFRPIFEKNFDNIAIVISPIFFKEISAPNNAPLAKWNYGYANAIMMSVNERIGVNLEFHGSITDDTHYIVPNIDMALGENSSVGLGLGFGLSSKSDDFTLRASIVTTF